jgi:hypothetical protein
MYNVPASLFDQEFLLFLFFLWPLDEVCCYLLWFGFVKARGLVVCCNF